MAKYLNNKGKQRAINLCSTDKYWWNVDKINEADIEEARNENWIAISSSCMLENVFEDVNPLYRDVHCSLAKYVKLYYTYAENDVLNLRPIAKSMTYPAFESSGDDNIPNNEFEREVALSKKEVRYFSAILQEEIGDGHDLKTQKIMTE